MVSDCMNPFIHVDDFEWLSIILRVPSVLLPTSYTLSPCTARGPINLTLILRYEATGRDSLRVTMAAKKTAAVTTRPIPFAISILEKR